MIYLFILNPLYPAEMIFHWKVNDIVHNGGSAIRAREPPNSIE